MSKLKAKPPESIDPGHIKAILFGRPGAGKTWLALGFPTPYYIDTEGGARLLHYTERLTKAGGSYMGPSEGANDLASIVEQVQALATEQHDYKTLVIDSISKPFMTAIANEQERLGDKDAFGASKKPAVAQMRRLINWLQRLDMNVFLIAHEVSEWGLVNGQRTEIGKTADVYDKLLYDLDLTLQIRAHSAKRRDAVVFKTRLTGFPAGDVIMLQDGEDKGYEEIASRYGRDFIEKTAEPIQVATADQVDQIKKLFDALNMPEEQITKLLTKANAETVAEMDSQTAGKLIAWLKAKIEV